MPGTTKGKNSEKRKREFIQVCLKVTARPKRKRENKRDFIHVSLKATVRPKKKRENGPGTGPKLLTGHKGKKGKQTREKKLTKEKLYDAPKAPCSET